MLNAKDEVKALMNEFASLKTAGQEADFKRKMDALLNTKDARQRDKFGKAMVEGAREVMAEADVLIETLINTK